MVAQLASSTLLSVPDDDEMWLQSDGFYPGAGKDVTVLPNGVKLLYCRHEVVPGSIHHGSHEQFERDASLKHLVLVMLEDRNGKVFRGLGEFDKNRNVVPVYGKYDGKPVLYNYTADLKPLPMPTNIDGNWYMDGIHDYLGMSPDHRFARNNDANKLIYRADGVCFIPQPQYFRFSMPYTDIILKARNGSATSLVSSHGQCLVMQVAATTNNHRGAGRGHKKGRALTGGYYLSFYADSKFPTTMNYNAQTGSLSLKFAANATKSTRLEGATEKMLKGEPEDAYWPSYIKSDMLTNDDVAFARQHLSAWSAKSPTQLWGDVKLTVVARGENHLVVRGRSAVEGETREFYHIWPKEGYLNRVLGYEDRLMVVRKLMEEEENNNLGKGKRTKSQAYESETRAKAEDYLKVFPLVVGVMEDAYNAEYSSYNRDKAPGEPDRQPYPGSVLLLAKQFAAEACGMEPSEYSELDNMRRYINCLSDETAMVNSSRRYKEGALYAGADYDKGTFRMAVMENRQVKILEIPMKWSGTEYKFDFDDINNAPATAYDRFETLLPQIAANEKALDKSARSAIKKELKDVMKYMKKKPRNIYEYHTSLRVAEKILASQEKYLKK